MKALGRACLVLALLSACSTKKISDSSPAQDTEIESLISQLGEDSPEVRTAAEVRLRAIGKSALAPLRKARHHSDREVRIRANELAKTIEGEHVFYNFPVRELTWEGVFASRRDWPGLIYMVLGTGFFLGKESADRPMVMKEWLSGRDAKCRVVSVLDSLVYIIVTDGDSCLNVTLVEKGCVEGYTMRSAAELVMPRDEYEVFLKQVDQAEARAQQAKLGVWRSD